MKNTMQRIVTATRDSDTLIAAGEMVELRFKNGGSALSLRSAKLLHLLVDIAGAKACEDVEHKAQIASLNFSHLESDALVDCIHDLQQTLVEFTYKDSNGVMRVRSSPLMAEVDRPKELQASEGWVVFRLSGVLQLLLKNSNHWAALSRDVVLSFESRYALRLYELIALRANLRHKDSETFDLLDLRRRLGVPNGKLSGWSPFRQKALEPAILEVNDLSMFSVLYEAHRQGRRVDRVTISWAQGSISERGQVARQLAQHSIPKAHHQQDQGMLLLPPSPIKDNRNSIVFPKYSNIRHGDENRIWLELAEKNLQRLPGGYLPDLGEVTKQFRSWCDSKKIPLNSKTIQKAFVGFCEKYRPPNA